MGRTRAGQSGKHKGQTRVASTPPMSGIDMSIRITSNCRRLSAAVLARSTASCPLLATSHTSPRFCSIFFATVWFIRLSSASSTRRPCRIDVSSFFRLSSMLGRVAGLRRGAPPPGVALPPGVEAPLSAPSGVPAGPKARRPAPRSASSKAGSGAFGPAASLGRAGGLGPGRLPEELQDWGGGGALASASQSSRLLLRTRGAGDALPEGGFASDLGRRLLASRGFRAPENTPPVVTWYVM